MMLTHDESAAFWMRSSPCHVDTGGGSAGCATSVAGVAGTGTGAGAVAVSGTAMGAWGSSAPVAQSTPGPGDDAAATEATAAAGAAAGSAAGSLSRRIFGAGAASSHLHA